MSPERLVLFRYGRVDGVPANGVSFTEVRDRNPEGENCDGNVGHSESDVREPEASAQSLAK